jgi:hypothetical protein
MGAASRASEQATTPKEVIDIEARLDGVETYMRDAGWRWLPSGRLIFCGYWQ